MNIEETLIDTELELRNTEAKLFSCVYFLEELQKEIKKGHNDLDLLIKEIDIFLEKINGGDEK